MRQHAEQFFLMAPVVNFSSTFSTCSLQQMQPTIAAAACVVPLRIADVLPDVPTTVPVLVGEPFDIPIDVRSAGDLAAQNVQLRITNPTNLQLSGADTAAGTCSFDGIGLLCQLGAPSYAKSIHLFLSLSARSEPR